MRSGVRAGNQGHGQNREHALEGHKNGMRQIGCGRSGRALNPVQKKVGKVTDHAAEVIAEGQGVAHQGPKHGDQPQAGVTVHVGGKHIARPNQAAVKQGQRRGHQHDHCGADDHKSRIRSVHHKLPCGRCPHALSVASPSRGRQASGMRGGLSGRTKTPGMEPAPWSTPNAAHAAPPVVLQGTIHARAAKQRDQTYTILILQIIFSSSKETVASFTGKQACFSTKLSKKKNRLFHRVNRRKSPIP